MKAALCIFSGQSIPSELITEISGFFGELFPEIQTDVFYDLGGGNLKENLLKVKWKKRQREISSLEQYDVNIAINSDNYKRLQAISNLDVQDGILYFTDGYFKHLTNINLVCFYGKSLVFDRASEFNNWSPAPGLDIKEENKFYWYVKTWKINTVCVDMANFKIL